MRLRFPGITSNAEVRACARGETRRVKIADSLWGAGYYAARLGPEFDEAIEDMILCLTIRNNMLIAFGMTTGAGDRFLRTWSWLRRLALAPIQSI